MKVACVTMCWLPCWGRDFCCCCWCCVLLQLGQHASKAELQAVAQFLQGAKRRVEVVKPNWLHLCHEEQGLLVGDVRCKIFMNTILQQAGLAPTASAVGATAAAAGPLAGATYSSGDSNAGFPAASSGIAGGVFGNSASRQGFPGTAQEQQQSAPAWVPEYWTDEQKPSDPSRVFENCWFTVAALTDNSEHQRALEYVR